jgi:hypothetical protein
MKNLERMWGVVMAYCKELCHYLPIKTKENVLDIEPTLSEMQERYENFLSVN